MARLIDADALIKEAMKSSNYFIIKYAVQNAPTIDAVPVVRCKDCKWWHDNGTLTGFCERLGTLGWFSTDYNDFCSFAERKDDETDRR